MIGGALVAAVAAVAQVAPVAPPAKPPVAIVGDADAPRVRERASATAAAAWQSATSLWGGDPKPGERAPSLHLYREIADYEKACDRLVKGDFKRNLCFAEWTDWSAHVVLQPPVRGDAEKRLAPSWTTLRLVAHETAHLARYGALPNSGSHPGWLCDGSATWVETQALAERGKPLAPDDVPFFATDELRVQRLLRDGKVPEFGALLLDQTDALDFYGRYALRWLLFRFLIEGAHADAFKDFLGDVRREGGGGEFKERIAVLLQKRFGVPDWKSVDAEFHAWIGKLAPKWEQAHVALEIGADEWTQCSFDDTNAVAFRTEPAGAKPYALEGAVTLLADRSKSPQANLLLGHDAIDDDRSRFVSVALVPGDGATIFDYDASRAADAQWKNLGFAKLPGTAVGKALPFRVDCKPHGEKTDVTLLVDGRPIAHATVDRVLHGGWGVGVQAGSSCTWRGVKLVAGR